MQTAERRELRESIDCHFFESGIIFYSKHILFFDVKENAAAVHQFLSDRKLLMD